MWWQAQRVFGREESRVFYQDPINPLGMEAKKGGGWGRSPTELGMRLRNFTWR